MLKFNFNCYADWNGAQQDFQKAFDTVPHKRVIVKLQTYDISGVIVNGITSRKEALLMGRVLWDRCSELTFELHIKAKLGQ